MTDLGDLAVTVDVPQLPVAWVQQALQSGLQCARECQAEGFISGAVLVCQGQSLTLPMSSGNASVFFQNEGLALA